MIQLILMIVTIINFLSGKKATLEKMQADFFPEAPPEKFHEWVDTRLEVLYYGDWAGWKLFLISIFAFAVTFAAPSLGVILQVIIVAAFIYLLVLQSKASAKANKLSKQYGFKIMKAPVVH